MDLRNLLMAMSLVLSIAIGFFVRGNPRRIATESAVGQEVRIGLSMDSLKEARWQIDRDTIVARCGELGAKILVEAANSDDSQQIRDVESLLTSGIRVLIVIPHDAVAMAKAVDMAHKAGVPIIAYDRLIRDSDVDLAVLFDNVHVGELQARYLVDHLPTPGKGKIIRIYGAKTDYNSRQFKAGQDRVLDPLIRRGDIQVVHEDWAEDWTPENAKKIVNAAISRHGRDFDAVLASNDGTASGAIQALIEEGMARHVLVTGQDAELAACQRIADGTQAMSIYKPLHALATTAASAAVSMARGAPIIARSAVNNGKIDVPTLMIDVVVLTRDNMLQTVVRDGFHGYDEIYRGVPEGQRPPRP
jgi:D-xylose transport system substrate-binding protein